MPAHVPRRSFAKPFIVTVAAAAAAVGCHETVYDNPPPRNPPPQDTAVPSATTAPSASSAPIANDTPDSARPDSAKPAPNASGASADETWQLHRDDVGKTCTVYASIDCKPGWSCNPPPPAAYACPTNVTKYPTTIRLAKGETECKVRIYSEMGTCPPHTMCNPPPPHDVVVPCPK